MPQHHKKFVGKATLAKHNSMQPRHHKKFVWKATSAKHNSMPRHRKKFVGKATSAKHNSKSAQQLWKKNHVQSGTINKKNNQTIPCQA
jgi:hypothetical protein